MTMISYVSGLPRLFIDQLDAIRFAQRRQANEVYR